MLDITTLFNNPWKAILKTPPHILKEDIEALKKHKKMPENMGWKIGLIPIPYIGNYKKASVIILCLNPGYREKLDLDDYNNKYYFKENVKTLTMKSRVPFFFLDPKIDFSGGYIWWAKILKQLISKFGLKLISKKIMCLQYLGYHSKTYINPPCILPSQKFTFNLLRQAIKDQKTIVIMRSKKLWIKAVPELENYPYVELKNYRRPFLTERNMGRENFERLVESLNK